MKYLIHKADKNIVGNIVLDSSKSISNRVLIIQALCKSDFAIHRLSTAKDTQTLLSLLSQKEEIYDAGPAGTTFRFLTAFLATQEGTQIMTGSERMKQRPIGDLVNALRQLGANIEYLETEGFPPLRIHAPQQMGATGKVSVAASTSSQFISALLLIAPTMPQGLELTLEGDIVSRSYIEMTLTLMQNFGIHYEWTENIIKVAPQDYQAKDFTVEADWSAASYYYIMSAFAENLDLQLDGLYSESTQGDSIVAKMGEYFGIETIFNESGLRLKKSAHEVSSLFEWDFILCPDIAQSLAVMCGGVGMIGLFTGLETLKVKETDRIAALQNELAKMQVWFSLLPQKFSKRNKKQYYNVDGKATWEGNVIFPTYEDHRMAMAFAPLAILGDVIIEEPNVVEKSYPNFWEDLKILGFDITTC
jgi:3-phosphoshikimate 1-carboxyvinyltransferase